MQREISIADSEHYLETRNQKKLKLGAFARSMYPSIGIY